MDVFDTLVVNEYLEWRGNQGGPLVNSFNESSRSDLRLYESDSNATMIELANQGKGFLDTCVTLMQRMLETVPKGVVLSDIISPMSVKPINATLDYDEKGNVLFKGYIRVSDPCLRAEFILISQTLTPATSSVSNSLTLTPSTSKPIPLEPETTPGSNVFGTTLFFPFSTTVNKLDSFHAFTVTGYGPPRSFSVQTDVFVVPSLTSSLTTTSSTILNVTIATRSKNSSFGRRMLKRNSTPRIRVQVPVGQAGTLAPAIKTFEPVAVSKTSQKSGYDLWSGSINVGDIATGSVSVAILNGKGEEVDIAFF